jgi:ABC-type lipoprotein export system ATPase subunit
MKLTSISISGLFGQFDYEIPLKAKDGVTIIHAPNGYGKTTILKLLDALFNLRFEEARGLSFGNLKLEFGDGSTLSVKKTIPGDTGRGILESRLSVPGREEISYVDVAPPPTRLDLLWKTISGDWKPGRHGEHSGWLRDFRSFFTHIEESEDRRNEGKEAATAPRSGGPGKLPADMPLDIPADMPEEIINLLDSVSARFIGSQRLISMNEGGDGDDDRDAVPSVTVHSEQLKKMIGNMIEESAEFSEQLDRTFPVRLIREIGSERDAVKDQAAIEKKLMELDRRRDRLQEVGLLYPDRSKSISQAGEIQELTGSRDLDGQTMKVLSLYIEDNEKKLRIFDKLARKLELLMNIINRRFEHKRLVIDRNRGFLFRLSDGKILSPDMLSSGEQHELVMYYELLFRSEPGSLILIDEPEISLHIMWQEQFLNDLLDIAGLNDLSVLMATHSPQIISDRWDLTVGLVES